MSALCRSCDAEILWRRTAAGQRIPIDALPDPQGNVEILDSIEAKVHGGPVDGGHLSHFATCPDAAKHRRPR